MSRHHKLIHEDMILGVKREPDMIPINVWRYNTQNPTKKHNAYQQKNVGQNPQLFDIGLTGLRVLRKHNFSSFNP